jgi:probable H4MPT-linked C1 transfer pathway protein
MPVGEDDVIGWDVGGAHLKACWLRAGRVRDVAQWACPLWQGLEHLDAALTLARSRWPLAMAGAHAVTMSGEMVDLFADRADGVRLISRTLADRLPGPVQLYAGPQRWVHPAQAADHWPSIASANWLACAQHAATRLGRGLLIDIGSTTTDVIAFDQGRVLGGSVSDRDRLATGELVCQGVVRTPLCALAPRTVFQGQTLNVMNEWFATTADVYRLTGELDPAHDQQPTADGADKSLPATRARLARLIGCDARDGSEADWLAFARGWRRRQCDEIASQVRRVLARHDRRPADAGRVVAAGCGAFLVPAVLERHGGPVLDYGRDVAPIDAARPETLAAWARVCAPGVAVAALWWDDHQTVPAQEPAQTQEGPG